MDYWCKITKLAKYLYIQLNVSKKNSGILPNGKFWLINHKVDDKNDR